MTSQDLHNVTDAFSFEEVMHRDCLSLLIEQGNITMDMAINNKELDEQTKNLVKMYCYGFHRALNQVRLRLAKFVD